MKTKWILAFAFGLVVNGLTSGVTIAQTQHNNGLGQTFVDSASLGTPGNAATYTLALANAAAAAFPFQGTVRTSQCGTSTRSPMMVVKQTATSCATWGYTGMLAGYAKLNQANNNCYCPTTADPTWR